MRIEKVRIVLVGHVSEDPLKQILIGTICFKKDDEGQLQCEPRLIIPPYGKETGSASDPFVSVFTCKIKGKYCLSFPDWDGGHGINLVLDRWAHTYRFVTGPCFADCELSGTVAHGGPELVHVLDQLLFADR